MVAGLERFREFFQDDSDQYVLIGGIAAMYWLSEAGLQPRATKDLDIVLIIETLRKEFLRRFWKFVKSGGYSSRHKGTGDRAYYRFSQPTAEDYPFMLEIFSRMPEGLDMEGAPTIVPIPGGQGASSLSAILMDDGYYGIVRNNVRNENGLSLLTPEGLILLKARAWLDLSRGKAEGQKVDSRNIKKHRTDVFKLSLLLPKAQTTSVPRGVYADLHKFLSHFPVDAPEWTSIRQSSGIGDQMPQPAELLDLLERHFIPVD